MNYDKDSFIAGIAVGRQMKGWASAGDGWDGGGVPWLRDITKATIWSVEPVIWEIKGGN